MILMHSLQVQMRCGECGVIRLFCPTCGEHHELGTPEMARSIFPSVTALTCDCSALLNITITGLQPNPTGELPVAESNLSNEVASLQKSLDRSPSVVVTEQHSTPRRCDLTLKRLTDAIELPSTRMLMMQTCELVWHGRIPLLSVKANWKGMIESRMRLIQGAAAQLGYASEFQHLILTARPEPIDASARFRISYWLERNRLRGQPAVTIARLYRQAFNRPPRKAGQFCVYSGDEVQAIENEWDRENPF